MMRQLGLNYYFPLSTVDTKSCELVSQNVTSNTIVSAAYILATIHLLYPKLGSFCDTEYYFYQLAYQDSKVPKCFLGLNQM